MLAEIEREMARKTPKRPEPAPKGWQSKPAMLQMRGSPEFKAWLERAAAHDRSSLALYLERAAIRYAKFIGFEESAPER
jgi:hypothetical protein